MQLLLCQSRYAYGCRKKLRITHAFGIDGKVIARSFWYATTLSFRRRNLGEFGDLLNQFLNLPIDEQCTSLFSPALRLLTLASIDSVSHLPNMFFSVVEVDDLNRIRKVFSDQLPDPNSSIP
jgi:hypothetical protein